MFKKYFILLLCALTITTGCQPTRAQAIASSNNSEKVTTSNNFSLILSLQEKTGNKVTNKIDVFSTQLDPNVSSINDDFYLEINGKKTPVSKKLLSNLSHARRSYSYDAQSGGISNTTPQAMCMMGGPAIGSTLYSRYLTYKSHKIVKDEMKPVYSIKGNCLFTENHIPKNQASLLDAVKAASTLNTIKVILGD